MSDLTDITELAPPPARVGRFPLAPDVIQPPGVPSWQRTGVALLLLLGAILLLYRDSALGMVAVWLRSDTFAHGILVFPIALWLIWRRRAELAAVPPEPTFWALLPLAAIGVAWLAGDVATVNVVSEFAFVALLAAATLAVLGIPATRVIMFPLAFMLFAVPTGEFLLPQLMEWTADFTVLALRLSGIPVYREGFDFVIPSGNWSVAEACSGVRYLIASFMVGTLFAYLNFRSMRRRLLFIAVSIVVPIVANWVRAYLIVMLGHLSGNKIAVGVDHLIYGWLFFGFVIMLMFWIGSRWSEPQSAGGLAHSLAIPATAPHTATLWPVCVLAAMVIAMPQGAKWLIDRSTPTAPVKLVAAPRLSPQWSAGSAFTQWKPAFRNPSAEINTVYANEGREVGLYVGYYRHQDAARKLVASANVLAQSGDTDWHPVGNGARALMVGGREIALRRATLRVTSSAPPTERGDLLVWQTYWVNGRFTSSDTVAKAQIALSKLMGHGDDSAVVIFYARAEPSGADALQSFVQAQLAAIEAQLLAARSDAR